jgi:hypothetical protein
VLVRPTTCRSGVPTQDGSKCSSLKATNSSTGRAVRSLKLKEAKMKRDKLLECGVIIVQRTKNGKLFIWIRLKVLKLRELTKTLVSMLTDHSTLFQNFHLTESLNVTVPIMFG